MHSVIFWIHVTGQRYHEDFRAASLFGHWEVKKGDGNQNADVPYK